MVKAIGTIWAVIDPDSPPELLGDLTNFTLNCVSAETFQMQCIMDEGSGYYPGVQCWRQAQYKVLLDGTIRPYCIEHTVLAQDAGGKIQEVIMGGDL